MSLRLGMRNCLHLQSDRKLFTLIWKMTKGCSFTFLSIPKLGKLRRLLFHVDLENGEGCSFTLVWKMAKAV